MPVLEARLVARFNRTTSPPWPSQLELPPGAAGHFRFVRRLSAPASRRRTHVLLPLEPAVLEVDGMAAALRALLGWGTAAPLEVHFAGHTAAIVRALLVAAPVRASAGTLRALRAHRFHAHPLALPYGEALRDRYPRCAPSALFGQMLRLLAPALLPSWARDALILDPLALVMLPPTRLMRHMRTEHVRTEAHTAQAGAGSRCALGVADWRALAVVPDRPRFDTAVLYMDLICARENGWLAAAGSATRRVLGSAPDSDARVGATSHPDCPSALLDEASLRRPAHAPRGVAAELSLGCEWSYEALAHAALGRHHRLVTLPSEGLSSVYIVCARDLMHQAFARAWERAHAHVYGGRRCACGQRLAVLQHPRDARGGYYDLHPSRFGRPATDVEQQAAPPTLHADGGTYLLTALWQAWGSFSEEAWRTMREHYVERAAAESVLAIADRTREGEPLLVIPRWPVPLGAPYLRQLRATAAAAAAAGDPGSAVKGAAVKGAAVKGAAVKGGADGALAAESVPKQAIPVLYPCGYAGAEEAWIPQVLLRACHVRLVCIADLVDDLAHGRYERGAAAVVPGALVVAQSQQLAIVEALASTYRVQLSDLVLIHISDGNIWQHRVATSAAEYRRWRHAFRQYWLPDASGALATARSSDAVEWFPIGMNPQWVLRMAPVTALDVLSRVPKASTRRHFLSFLGSTDKSDRAKRIALVDGALDLLSVRSVRGGGVDDDEEATLPARVFHRRGNVACYGSACDDEAYVRATLDSALCLQLPGSSVESNRLYEGLEGGCIPVVVLRFGPGEAAVGTVPTYDADAIEAVNAAFEPLRNVTGEPPPFVFVTHESELSARLAALAWSAERLDEQQALTMAWWRDAKRYYARAFTRWACPKPREGLKAEL